MTHVSPSGATARPRTRTWLVVDQRSHLPLSALGSAIVGAGGGSVVEVVVGGLADVVETATVVVVGASVVLVEAALIGVGSVEVVAGSFESVQPVAPIARTRTTIVPRRMRFLSDMRSVSLGLP